MRSNVKWRAATALAALVAAAGALALAVYFFIIVARRRRREGFSLSKVFGTVKNAVVGGVEKVVDGGKKVVQGGKNLIGKGGSDKYVPTYVGRQFDGRDWACPMWTVDTGLEDARACISSQYHPPMWRAGEDGAWGWGCPNGTVPTDESTWEKKCEVGWMARQLIDGKWQCPWGTEDQGRTWDNSSWRDAQKQCRRSRPYTTRVKGAGGKWVCPAGSTDTGRTWGQPGEWDQCKWNGG